MPTAGPILAAIAETGEHGKNIEHQQQDMWQTTFRLCFRQRRYLLRESGLMLGFMRWRTIGAHTYNAPWEVIGLKRGISAGKIRQSGTNKGKIKGDCIKF